MLITNMFFILTYASMCICSKTLFFNCIFNETIQNPFYIIFSDKNFPDNDSASFNESSYKNVSNSPYLFDTSLHNNSNSKILIAVPHLLFSLTFLLIT